MDLSQPTPTREPKQTFLVVYSNPNSSDYLHWLKRKTDHHELALDRREGVTDLDHLIDMALERAEVEAAVGSAFDEVWVVFDGPRPKKELAAGSPGIVVNTPDISVWLDMHQRPDDQRQVFSGRYSQARAQAIAAKSSSSSTMYLLVDALLESLRAFRALDAPPSI